jgi:dUTP pyrophosphatase
MQIHVKRLARDARIPVYATSGAACFDLYAYMPDEQRPLIRSSAPQTFHTGLAFEIPPGHVMLVFSRSGHGFKADTRLANCVGVIDSDFRGEVMVRLTRDDSDSTSPMRVRHGDRIAQAMIVQIPAAELVEAEELSQTERDTGGLGSTGE